MTSKMSMAGWWMVHAMVRPVFTILRTTRITIAAARASSPDVGSSLQARGSGANRPPRWRSCPAATDLKKERNKLTYRMGRRV